MAVFGAWVLVYRGASEPNGMLTAFAVQVGLIE